MLTRRALISAAATAVLAITGALAVAPAASGQQGSSAAAASSPARSAPVADATLASASAPSAAFPSSASETILKEMAAAWRISRGQGVTVAVLSDGVDPISGLAGKLTQGPDYAPLPGASQVDGTLLASAIAGSGPASAQPSGALRIAPEATILAERIGNYNNSGQAARKYQAGVVWQSIMAKAIDYAVEHGAGVIVLDGTGDADAADLDAAVAYAVSQNVILVAGEDVGGTKLMYPDSLPGVINSTAQPLEPLPKSEPPQPMPVNDSVLVSAPGDQMLVTGPGGGQYTIWDHYSAVPWVAGTAAIIKSAYPNITDAEVEAALAESANYHPAGGYNTAVGFGLINPQGALADAARLVKERATAPLGATALSASARFGSRPAAVIDAVHRAPGVLATDGAVIIAALILLIIALILLRKRPRPAVTAGPSDLALSPAPSGHAASKGVPAGSEQVGSAQQEPRYDVPPAEPSGPAPAPAGPLYYVAPAQPPGAAPAVPRYSVPSAEPTVPAAPAVPASAEPAPPGPLYYVPPAEPAAPAPGLRYYVRPAQVPPVADEPAGPAEPAPDPATSPERPPGE